MQQASEDAAVAQYLKLVESAANAIDIPLIGSLNASSLRGWVANAGRLVDAGASAIELNIHLVPGAVRLSGADVESRHIDILHSVREAARVPAAVKISRTSLPWGTGSLLEGLNAWLERKSLSLEAAWG